jgi:trans-2,3-dihydro-3-hydroxyanthranilate isomerase
VGAHRYTLLDVFTATPLEGNALAVVHDADELDDSTMLAFARETWLSETTFVQRAHVAGADYRNRIWTVERELPFAGHPSLGTAVAVARAERTERTQRPESLDADEPREVRYVQQTGAGLQPIDVRLESAHKAYASMLQEPAVLGAELPRAQVVAAIGLTPEHADRALPPQLVGSGLTQLILPLRDRDALARARPDWPVVERLLATHGATVLYAAVCDPGSATARTRSFVSAAVGEDPATGSAAGPLCAYLAARADCPAVTIAQGVEIGRPSRLEAAMEGERPRVGGDVVVVADGTLQL